jgi:hypothetical protein
VSAVLDLHPSRALVLDSTLEDVFSVPQLTRAREALAASDLAAYSAACLSWLYKTRGITLGDGVLLTGRRQPVEVQVEDFALSWQDGDTTAEPLLWFYGLTVQADGQRVVRQWNRTRHDTGVAKVACPSDTLALHLVRAQKSARGGALA